MKPILKLLKEDIKFEWTNEGRKVFNIIKDLITRSPVLISPDYSKDFQIFSFASEDTIAEVFLQKNDEQKENPLHS